MIEGIFEQNDQKVQDGLLVDFSFFISTVMFIDYLERKQQTENIDPKEMSELLIAAWKKRVMTNINEQADVIKNDKADQLLSRLFGTDQIDIVAEMEKNVEAVSDTIRQPIDLAFGDADD